MYVINKIYFRGWRGQFLKKSHKTALRLEKENDQLYVGVGMKKKYKNQLLPK